MRTMIKLIAILLVILLLSAALAPAFYQLFDRQFKFEKVFKRLIMIFTLVATVLFVRVNPKELLSYGLTWKKDSLKLILTAFAGGVLTLMLLTVVRVRMGAAVWSIDEPWSWGWTLRSVGFLGAAFLIGVIEEFFFRGFIYVSLKDRLLWGWIPSLVATNLFYSFVHFTNYYKPFIGRDPTFFDSFRLVAVPFVTFWNWHPIFPEALGLFLFGILLTTLVIRSKSLYPAIGFHAGCVFFIKSDGFFVHPVNMQSLVFGTEKLVDGILAWIFLIVLIWLVRRTKTMQSSIRLMGVSGLLVMVFLPWVWAGPMKEDKGLPSQFTVVYRFHEHLAEAETWIIDAVKGDRIGSWEKDRFVFPGMEKITEIALKSQTFNGQPEEGIYFHPLKDAVRCLRFYQVPAGSSLVIGYGIDDAGVLKDQRSYIFFRVWVGRHEIKRIVIPNERGWKTEKLDLGIVSFLKGKIPVTFEVSSDTTEGRFLSFRAEILGSPT
ncbi:MAG: CPBP family intramembrane metalloprotease [Candidatus Omnitrophica bacterium]|nr:CPBP family intramembrane metalloprotease [Candidatus Omnitrophota bacterium]